MGMRAWAFVWVFKYELLMGACLGIALFCTFTLLGAIIYTIGA